MEMSDQFKHMQIKRNRSSSGIALINSALSAMLLIAAAYVGPVGAFLHIFLAVPIAIAGYTAGMLAAFVVLLVSVIVQFAVAGEFALVLYLAQFGLPGLCLVYALRYNVGWPRAVCYTLLVGIFALGVLVAYAAYSTDSSVSALVNDYIDAQKNQVHAVYSEAGVEEKQLTELVAVVENTAAFLKRAYIGITVVALGVVYLVTVVVLYAVGRGKFSLPGVDFHYFKIAEPVIWLLIAAGFALLVPLSGLQDAALNVLTVLLPLYFVQGIAIVAFYFRKKAFSFLARFFAYAIVLIINPLPLMVAALGIFDLWFDFRKPRVKTT